MQVRVQEQEIGHRRYEENGIDSLPLDGLEDLGRVEDLREQHDGRSDQQMSLAVAERREMKERRRGADAKLVHIADIRLGGHLHDGQSPHHHLVLVGEDGALGPAGGARGVHDKGGVVVIQQHQRLLVGVLPNQALEVKHPLHRLRRQRYVALHERQVRPKPFDGFDELLTDDEGYGVGVVHDELELVGMKPEV